MSINRQEFTNAGRDMLGRANNGETLTISRIVIGSGRAEDSSSLWPLTVLLNHELDVPINQKVDQGDGVLLVNCAFNSSRASDAFELCEVGVMARIGAETERLYSVANVLATGADHVDPDVESIHAFNIKIKIDRAEHVTIIIGDSSDILAENIGPEIVGPGWFHEKLANTLRFKRAVEGTGIELLNELETITISQKTLRINLDLYVPLNHPDAPGPEVAFPSLELALEHLLQYRIPANREATVHIAAGNFDILEGIEFNHPDASQVSIIGEPMQTVIGSNIRSAGPGIFDFTVPDSNLFPNAGDTVCIRAGSVDGRWSGIRNIVGAIGPTDVRASTAFQVIDYTTPVPGAFEVNYWPTVFRCTSSFLSLPYGLKLIRDLCIVGGTDVGVGISSGYVTLNNVGIRSFGITAVTGARASIIIIGSCSLGSSGIGARMTEGSTFVQNRPCQTLIVNGNSFAGFYIEYGSYLSLGPTNGPLDYDCMVPGNGTGIYCDSNGLARISAMTVALSANGLFAQTNGFIDVGVNGGPISVLNSTSDVVARTRAAIIGNRNGGTMNNASFSPPNSSLGADQGFIYILPIAGEEEEEEKPELPMEKVE